MARPFSFYTPHIMEQTFQVYIIQSQKHGRFYIGRSHDPEKRLHFHNLGWNTSTQNGVPWISIWVSDPLSKTEASTLENKVKRRGAQRFLDDMKTQ